MAEETEDELELARTTGFCVAAMMRFANGSERRAAGLLYSAACSWSLSLGVPPESLVDSLFVEVRRLQNTEEPND
jgi:hypothetical protein